MIRLAVATPQLYTPPLWLSLSLSLSVSHICFVFKNSQVVQFLKRQSYWNVVLRGKSSIIRLIDGIHIKVDESPKKF